MEKRVAARSRPSSRESSNSSSFSSSTSSSIPTLPSLSPSPSSSHSRSIEVIPPDLFSFSPLPSHSPSRPSTSSSLSPLSSINNNNNNNNPRPPSSPLGSPSNGRRKLRERDLDRESEREKDYDKEKRKTKEKEREKGTKDIGGDQNGVFLTSLRGESSLSSYSDEADEIITRALNSVADIPFTNEEDGKEYAEIQEKLDLMRLEAEQAARRAELDSYMVELKHKQDVVVFPKNFNEILEAYDTDQMDSSAFWDKFTMDPSADDPWVVDERLAKGLARIRKLDVILAKKTKQANELQRANNPKIAAEEKTKKDKGKSIPGPPQLTQLDEQRIAAILAEDDFFDAHSDSQTDISSVSDSLSRASNRDLKTPFEEDLDGLFDIDLKLAEIIPTTEWDAKGLAHLRPTSANSRVSYTSHSSLSSASSYATYLTLASRTSMGKQASKELEKEREEEAVKEKARMKEIDTRLRELSKAEAQLAKAGDALRARNEESMNGEEIEVDIEKADPDEIRRMVRMLSRPDLA